MLNYLKQPCIKFYYGIRTVGASISLLVYGSFAYADGGLIPTSSIERTNSNEGVVSTFMNMFKEEFIPILALVIAVVLLVTCAFAIVKGLNDFRREREFEHLKMAIISSVVAIASGGAVLYILVVLVGGNK